MWKVTLMPLKAFVRIKPNCAHKVLMIIIMALTLLRLEAEPLKILFGIFLKFSSTSDTTRVSFCNAKHIVLNLAINFQLRHEVMSQV